MTYWMIVSQVGHIRKLRILFLNSFGFSNFQHFINCFFLLLFVFVYQGDVLSQAFMVLLIKDFCIGLLGLEVMEIEMIYQLPLFVCAVKFVAVVHDYSC